MPTDKRVAVIIPCYNEEHTILQVIDEIHTILPQARICVFDNNSTDNSKALIESTIATKMGGGGARASSLHSLLVYPLILSLASLLTPLFVHIYSSIVSAHKARVR